MTDATNTIDLDAAQARAAKIAKAYDLPVPQLLAEDGAPHDEIIAFCEDANCTLDWIFCGAPFRFRKIVAEPDPFEVKAIRLAHLVGALKVVAEDFKELRDTDPIGRDRRDAVIGLAEAMAALID